MVPRVHPAVLSHWMSQRAGSCHGVPLGWGEPAAAETHACECSPHGFEGGFTAGPFAVRRPLRFLAHKLGLREGQVAELARILDELKTERAQAAVDDRRTLASFAEALAGETFDEARAREAARQRTGSAERLSGEVVKALGRIHALLDADQRARFAYMIRTGSLLL